MARAHFLRPQSRTKTAAAVARGIPILPVGGEKARLDLFFLVDGLSIDIAERRSAPFSSGWFRLDASLLWQMARTEMFFLPQLLVALPLGLTLTRQLTLKHYESSRITDVHAPANAIPVLRPCFGWPFCA